MSLFKSVDFELPGFGIRDCKGVTYRNNICRLIFRVPTGTHESRKGAWILDKLRAGFLSGPFFDCAKIKDFFILRERSFPHYFKCFRHYKCRYFSSCRLHFNLKIVNSNLREMLKHNTLTGKLIGRNHDGFFRIFRRLEE